MPARRVVRAVSSAAAAPARRAACTAAARLGPASIATAPAGTSSTSRGRTSAPAAPSRRAWTCSRRRVGAQPRRRRPSASARRSGPRPCRPRRPGRARSRAARAARDSPATGRRASLERRLEAGASASAGASPWATSTARRTAASGPATGSPGEDGGVGAEAPQHRPAVAHAAAAPGDALEQRLGARARAHLGEHERAEAPVADVHERDRRLVAQPRPDVALRVERAGRGRDGAQRGVAQREVAGDARREPQQAPRGRVLGVGREPHEGERARRARAPPPRRRGPAGAARRRSAIARIADQQRHRPGQHEQPARARARVIHLAGAACAPRSRSRAGSPRARSVHAADSPRSTRSRASVACGG